ncbi:MAG TPA: TadE/TadG family type IV pilus assembly protein [Bacillales bacterium]|nr:TadE/TadG family type IV pilus assembly protein [Bacillales bacterium]
MRISKSLGKLRKNESGSFTLEASLIFPILLILTVSLVFFSLIVYEQVVLHQRAQVIADRMAFSWNNSLADLEDGSFGRNEYTTDVKNGDGLYWRVTSNQFLSKFGLNLDAGSGEGLVAKKMDRVNRWKLSGGAKIEKINFDNNLLGGNITVTLSSPLQIPDSLKKMFGIKNIEATAKADVSEPVEFIRTTDLTVTYVKKLLNVCQTTNCKSAIGKFKKK